MVPVAFVCFAIFSLFGGIHAEEGSSRNVQKRELPIVLEPGPVILPSKHNDKSLTRRNASPCTKAYIAECLDQLLTFTELNNLRFVQYKHKLEHFCMVTETGYNCTKTLYDQNLCLSEIERDLFPNYESLISLIYGLLCVENKNNSFKSELLNSSSCFVQQRSKLYQCYRKSNVPEVPMLSTVENTAETLAKKSHRICCSLEQYIDCARKQINATCGPHPAKTIASYIHYATGMEVMGFCQQSGFHNYPVGMDKACVSKATKKTGMTLWIVLFIIPWCVVYQFSLNLL